MSRLIKYICLVVLVELVLCLGSITPVLAADAELELSDDEGVVGDSIKLTGTGFDSYETVVITFSYDDEDEYEAETNSSGKFTKTIQIPNCPGEDYTFEATGEDSGAYANADFEVLPSLKLNKTSGEIGSSLVIYGYGFRESETGIDVTFNNTVVSSSLKANTSGYFYKSLNVPSLSAGTYTVTAEGDDSSASIEFTISVNAKISATKTSGPAGTAVTVSGTGFSPAESGITVTLGGKVMGTTSASSSGAWSVNFTTPVMSGGTYIIDASGSSTNNSLVPDLSFKVEPVIDISPRSGSPGSTVSVEGTGFGSSESITLVYDSTDVQTGIKADSEGSFTGQFTVPAGSSGAHKVYAKGTTTPKTPTAGVDFSLGAGIEISKSEGISGTVVSIKGNGFAAKETDIKIIFDGSTRTSVSGAADESGSWTTNYTIPETAGGTHTIGAEGKTTKADIVTGVTFSILPQIDIDTTEGPIGTAVTFTASGFVSGESGISIAYDGQAQGSKITADINGNWKSTVIIPPSPSGQHTLQVIGTVTDATQAGFFSFEVASMISLSADSGYIGSSVTVSGAGFYPNGSLKLYYDGIEMSVGLISADKSGNFSKTITIPKSTGGSHVIRVMDSQNNSAETVFVMDSEAPPVPRQNEPEDGVSMGLFGNITPVLEWSKVTDQSGVTYNLQLDTDPEFGDPIIDITNSTSNKYSIKKADALPRGEYYWRVQAVDGASNASDWTDPRLLISGKIAPILFILIIIVLVAGLGVGIYFLLPVIRRKMKSKEPQDMPEIVIPEVVNGEYKQVEGEKKALPWRLALPQAPTSSRGSKTSSFSEEDQARLKVIIDFAKSVPLAEPGANTNWLVDLAENSSGLSASPALYAQLVKGELQLRYEPAWMRHPTYLDLQTLLEGQPLLQDLNTFIDTVDRTAADAESVLGDIYQEIVGQVTWDIFNAGGWAYISAVYVDSFNWFQGKYLKEPSERDYTIKAETMASGEEGFSLYAEINTPFSGLMIQVSQEQDAQNLRALHLKLRRNFRNSDRIKTVVTSIIQIEVQRNRLVNSFRQFNRLSPS